MAENLTKAHRLVEEITSNNWFANPAGRQGFEVILLEQVGDGGTRFYHSLQPGETLKLNERLFGKFRALAVDIRSARSFEIDKEFHAIERGRKIQLGIKVYYHVQNARVVAMETVDPLGELRDKVIATLTRELVRYTEDDISPILVQSIIQKIGFISHIGLVVDDADIIKFSRDERITSHEVQVEDVHHDIHIDTIREDAAINLESRRQRADVNLRQERHDGINLSNLNTLMHEHPELIPTILETLSDRERRLVDMQFAAVKPAIEAYIQQQREINAPINPEEVGRMMRNAITSDRQMLELPNQSETIVWGDESNPVLNSGDVKPSDERKSENDSKDSRIKFGD